MSGDRLYFAGCDRDPAHPATTTAPAEDAPTMVDVVRTFVLLDLATIWREITP